MVELVPHRGYLVSPLSRQDIEDIFWLQGQIAVKLALRAMDSITADQLAELTELNADLRAAVDASDAAAIEQCEFEFHRLINRAAGGAKLAWFPVRRDFGTPLLVSTRRIQAGVSLRYRATML